MKGSTAAVVTEATAVNTFTTAERMYTGTQIVTTSMKWVPPHATMKSPNAKSIQ